MASLVAFLLFGLRCGTVLSLALDVLGLAAGVLAWVILGSTGGGSLHIILAKMPPAAEAQH